MPAPSARAFPVVLLEHELPQGSSHIDLLLADPSAPRGDEDRTVRCWRCPVRPDLAAGACDLERIEDHRGFYLRLAQPHSLPGDRGVVRPLRRGSALETRRGDSNPRIIRIIELAITWEDGEASHWRLTHVEGNRWRIEPTCS